MSNFHQILFSILILALSGNLLFGISDASIAARNSIIPFQFSPASRPMLHLGVLNEKGMDFAGGFQISPTSNLLLGGVISPQQSGDDLALYYQVLAGYKPDWEFLKISSNMILVAMHRYRFGEGGDSRWISFTVTESANFGSMSANLCWNRLFSKSWVRNTLFASTTVKLLKNIQLQPGVFAYFTPKFGYTPFLFLSIIL